MKPGAFTEGSAAAREEREFSFAAVMEIL